MKNLALMVVRWFLVGGAGGLAVGLLEHYLHFSVPQALILLAILAAWWRINKKLDAIKTKTDWLHNATNALIMPRLTRVERRQRGWNVPEPPEENGKPGEYDDVTGNFEPQGN